MRASDRDQKHPLEPYVFVHGMEDQIISDWNHWGVMEPNYWRSDQIDIIEVWLNLTFEERYHRGVMELSIDDVDVG